VTLATLLAAYDPGLDGPYRITWNFQADGSVHSTLARVADMGPTMAYLIDIQSAILDLNHDTAAQLRGESNEVLVTVRYRINQLPTTYIARIYFFAGDIETLEIVNVVESAPVSC
jgi:hypothetical protein